MNKIEIIKQAIELKTGRKCTVRRFQDSTDIEFVYNPDGNIDRFIRLSARFIDYLPLSETEVNGVTEKNGWISVEEQLPDSGQDVLVCYKTKSLKEEENGLIKVGSGYVVINKDSTFWIIEKHFSWDIGTPTHWTQLPAPPINK